MPIQPGETIGTYRIIRRIGAGGTAEVFEVEHTVLATRHALKVLHGQWVESERIRGRFLAEGKLQAKFRHPGLVRVTDTLAEPGVAGLVMDLLIGETVRDRLEREGHIAPKEAVGWIRAALDALAEAHTHGVIHRDLKPENVFLLSEPTEAGARLKLLDFGIAKALTGATMTRIGAGAGTPAYMAPEQTRRGAAIDARADVYAAGLSFYEVLTGKHPLDDFRRSPLETVLSAQSKFTAKPPSKLLPPDTSPRIASAVDMIYERATAKEPSERFQSARDMAEAMMVFLSPV